MNKLNLYGQLLASEDQDSRELTYQLLPYGEDGFTNLGKVKASQGALDFPESLDELQLNLEHDYKKPLGKFTALTDDENGIKATVRIAETSRGNDALLEARQGLRTGISIEINSPVIKAGQIISGRISGAGLVVKPAFSNAQLIAEDFGTEQDSKNMENETPLVEQGAPLTAAHSEKVELGKVTFEALKSGQNLEAALADQLTTDDAGKIYLKDQEVGELFENRKSERPFVNKVGVKPLTGLVLTGTRRQRTFAVADWAGNKVELPTGKFTTSREYWNSKSKAVAVDIAMELIEFGDADVISDLYEQAVDSYIEQTEAELKAAVVAGATAVTGGATNVIDVVSKAAETLNGIGGRMDFVLLSPELYSKIVNLKTADAPYWLSGQSTVDIAGQRVTASGIVIASDVDLPAGTVVIGDVRAIDYRETKDFRYRAADIAKGGVDISLIKFNATRITDAGSILKFSGVTDAVAPAPTEPAA